MAQLDRIQLSGVTYFFQDASAATKSELSALAESVDTVLSGYATTASVANDFNDVVYDSNTKRINFKHGNTVIAYVDATDFVKDGMVSNVEIKTISGASYLAITFNSDAGKEEIDIALTDIFNPSNYYTKQEVDVALSGKQETLVAGSGITISGNVISSNGTAIVIDTQMDDQSTNPVQNRVITAAIDGLVQPRVSGTTLIFD